jgi:hypothetical protein
MDSESERELVKPDQNDSSSTRQLKKAYTCNVSGSPSLRLTVHVYM